MHVNPALMQIELRAHMHQSAAHAAQFQTGHGPVVDRNLGSHEPLEYRISPLLIAYAFLYFPWNISKQSTSSFNCIQLYYCNKAN